MLKTGEIGANWGVDKYCTCAIIKTREKITQKRDTGWTGNIQEGKMKMGKQEFVQSDEFISAVVSATQAGFGGSGYSVEFFGDGSHRVLWDGQIGNRYQSAGEIIAVPQLNSEQVAEADEESGEGLEEVAEFYRDELAEMFLSEE